MAKKKRVTWSPEDISLLMAIPKDQNSVGSLKKVAKKMKRTYPGIYAKWNSLKKSTIVDTSGSVRDTPVMKLKFDPDYEGRNTNIDEVETASFIKGLELELPRLKPMKGAILIPTRYVRIAKEYLSKNTKHHFIASSIVGNSKEKRLMMKV